MTRTSQNLWDFSLEHYAREDVPRLCLLLQDDFGFDVNLLFFTAWLTRTLNLCPPELLDAALALSGPWRTQVVSPLRAARRWMKQTPPLELIGSSADFHWPGVNLAASANHLREQIKAVELSAERQQQQLLEAMAQQWLGNAHTDNGSEAPQSGTGQDAAAGCHSDSQQETALAVVDVWLQLHQRMNNQHDLDVTDTAIQGSAELSQVAQPEVKKPLGQLAMAMFGPQADAGLSDGTAQQGPAGDSQARN